MCNKLKITKKAIECADSLVEDNYIIIGDRDLVALRIQTYMQLYCKDKVDRVEELEAILFADKADNVIESENP